MEQTPTDIAKSVSTAATIGPRCAAPVAIVDRSKRHIRKDALTLAVDKEGIPPYTRAIMADELYTVRLDKHRSTWVWFTTNPSGGGFGSNHCGAKKVALHKALMDVPVGAKYQVITNGKEGPIETRS